MKIEAYKPDGIFYGGFQDTISPVTIEIPNPDEGQWTFNVTALDLPHHNEYPFSLITGITKYQGDFNSDGDVDSSNLALLIDSGDYLWIYLQKITA
jgi:hypothetical protein